jgi:hypothetical protein
MPPSPPTSFNERVTRTLVGLARVTATHRVLVSGALGKDVVIELHRRGCSRVVTTTHCGLPRSQYDVAVVGCQRQSLRALEVTLIWLVHYLGPKGVLAIWIDSDESAASRKLHAILDRLGFRVEAGTSCENGLAVAARRYESIPLIRPVAKVA